MSYTLMTDNEIMQDIANKLDFLRRSKGIKDEILVSKGGTNRVVLNKFRNGSGGISLKTFIRLLRGIDELDKLEILLTQPEEYSPSGKKSSIPKKRVRSKKIKETHFSWGEDE